MKQITEEQINKYAFEKYGPDFNLYGAQRDGFKDGMKKAIELMQPEWIPVSERLPKFDVPVLVRCRIWGTFISTYEKVDPDYEWGNWRRNDELGILPPLFWTPLPEPPKTD